MKIAQLLELLLASSLQSVIAFSPFALSVLPRYVGSAAGDEETDYDARRKVE